MSSQDVALKVLSKFDQQTLTQALMGALRIWCRNIRASVLMADGLSLESSSNTGATLSGERPVRHGVQNGRPMKFVGRLVSEQPPSAQLFPRSGTRARLPSVV